MPNLSTGSVVIYEIFAMEFLYSWIFVIHEYYVFVMSGRIGHASKIFFPLSDPLKYFKYQCSTLPLHVCLSVCLSVCPPLNVKLIC